MEQSKAPWKIKVDKQLLNDFMSHPEKDYDQEGWKQVLKELKKVFNIVMIKHYSRAMYLKEELWNWCLLATQERRNKKQFDVNRSQAYNFLYSLYRNECGNKFHSFTKESLQDDSPFPQVEKPTEDYHEDNLNLDIPEVIDRWKDYLLGIKPFTVVRIPKKDVFDLLFFLKSHSDPRYKKLNNSMMEDMVQSDKASLFVLRDIINQLLE